MINNAISMLQGGVSVIPVNPVTKTPPKGFMWQKYQDEAMREDKAFQTFTDKDGIAAVCGKVSGGLEVIDFDNHFGDIKQIFYDWCAIEDVKEILKAHNLPYEETQSGGYHVFFRTESAGNNQKLASRLNSKGKADTLIETRGNGGYVIIAPTSKYVLKKGSLQNIPTITAEERDILLSAAKCYNEVIKEVQKFQTEAIYSDEQRPGDDYNASSLAENEAKQALIGAGWVNVFSTRWRRPGKKRGVSATFSAKHNGYFHVFSSNADPFESEKAYTPYQIIALLKFNGDFTATSRDLAKRGFGKSKSYPKMKVVYSTVRSANRRGEKMSSSEINEMAELNNIPVDEVAKVAAKLYKENEDEFGFDSKPDIEKAEIFLKKNYEFRQDMISKLAFMRQHKKNWEPVNEHTIYRNMQKNFIKFSLEKLKSLLRSDFVEKYNPFKSYFGSLPAWDKEDHIKNLASHFKLKKGEDFDFFEMQLKKAMVRNIKCALIDDYYNRIVFTIVSEGQEIGKSWFFQWLNPFGTDYYSDESLTDNKDSRFALTENFIYNLEELDSLSKMDLGRLKATISTRGVKERLPYASTKEYFPRVCSFWGSTNRQDFLVDDRNTRWLCFYIESIDWSYTEIDKIKLWAQAWHLYKSEEFDCQLTKEEALQRDQNNKQYEQQDYLSTIILRLFEPDNYCQSFMDNAEILEQVITSVDRKIQFSPNASQLGRNMARLGWPRGVKDGRRGWFVKLKGTLSTKEEAPPF